MTNRRSPRPWKAAFHTPVLRTRYDALVFVAIADSPAGYRRFSRPGVTKGSLEHDMVQRQAEGRNTAGGPHRPAKGLASCECPQTINCLRRIAEAIEAIAEDVARRSREWLDPADVAEEIRVSSDTVKRLMDEGRLRYKCIRTRQGSGKRGLRRVKRAWLDEYMNKSEAAAVRPAVSPTPGRRKHRTTDLEEVDYIG